MLIHPMCWWDNICLVFGANFSSNVALIATVDNLLASFVYSTYVGGIRMKVMNKLDVFYIAVVIILVCGNKQM